MLDDVIRGHSATHGVFNLYACPFYILILFQVISHLFSCSVGSDEKGRVFGDMEPHLK